MTASALFDTCVWIDFLRYSKGEAGDLPVNALENDAALLCGVITAELLQGAKGNKENKQLDLLFSSLESLPCDESAWHEAGLMLQKLKQKGITIPLTYALIVVIANRNDVDVVTLDKHFKHLPVKIINPAG